MEDESQYSNVLRDGKLCVHDGGIAGFACIRKAWDVVGQTQIPMSRRHVAFEKHVPTPCYVFMFVMTGTSSGGLHG